MAAHVGVRGPRTAPPGADPRDGCGRAMIDWASLGCAEAYILDVVRHLSGRELYCHRYWDPD